MGIGETTKMEIDAGLESELTATLGRARAFWEARVLMTAAELDVFSRLADAPKTSAQASRELSCDERGTEAPLNALVALGLLVKAENAFRVRPGFEKALSNSAPETVLPSIQHMAQLWSSWGQLTEIVRKGSAGPSLDAFERDEKGTVAFIGAMHTIGLGLARSVVQRLEPSGHLVNTPGGSTYSFEEISEDLEAAGFVDATLLHRGEMDSLVTARRPA